MSSNIRLFRLLVVSACLAMAAACAQLDSAKPTGWFADDVDEPTEARQLVAIWTDAVVQQPNRARTRGFRGQLFFYGPGGTKPVRVDGALIVYAYDEQERGEDDVKPTRKYVFTREQFARHYAKSDLGHCYAVWIPWDQVGGPRKQIALIARFVPADGTTLVSQQAARILPGMPPKSNDQIELADGSSAARRESLVRQVSHEVQSETGPSSGQIAPELDPNPAHRMRTTTIPIPPRFGRVTPVARAHFQARGLGYDGLQRPSKQTAEGVPTAAITRVTAVSAPQAPNAAAAGVPSTQQPPPSTGCLPGRFQAPGGPTAQRSPDHAPWPLRPAEWRSSPSSIPRSASGWQFEPGRQAGWPTPN
jgi:hypothetical protein